MYFIYLTYLTQLLRTAVKVGGKYTVHSLRCLWDFNSSQTLFLRKEHIFLDKTIVHLFYFFLGKDNSCKISLVIYNELFSSVINEKNVWVA